MPITTTTTSTTTTTTTTRLTPSTVAHPCIDAGTFLLIVQPGQLNKSVGLKIRSLVNTGLEAHLMRLMSCPESVAVYAASSSPRQQGMLFGGDS
jgi:hypothetical protein